MPADRSDRFTRAELLEVLEGQLPMVPRAMLDRLAGILVLMYRPAEPPPAAPPAPTPPPPAARSPRRQYKEKPAAERLRLKK